MGGVKGKGGVFHRQEDEFKRRNPAQRVTGMGVFDDNPLRLNADEACALAGLDIKVDGLVTRHYLR